MPSEKTNEERGETRIKPRQGTQDRGLRKLSEDELDLTYHLVMAREHLWQITKKDYLRFEPTNCTACGLSSMNPKHYWQADQALEGAWTRINKVLSLFGVKHALPSDFDGFGEEKE